MKFEQIMLIITIILISLCLFWLHQISAQLDALGEEQQVQNELLGEVQWQVEQLR